LKEDCRFVVVVVVIIIVVVVVIIIIIIIIIIIQYTTSCEVPMSVQVRRLGTGQESSVWQLLNQW
jgi:hypothetical protein